MKRLEDTQSFGRKTRKTETIWKTRGSVSWIHLASVSGSYKHGNELRVRQMRKNLWLAEKPLDSEKNACSVEYSHNNNPCATQLTRCVYATSHAQQSPTFGPHICSSTQLTPRSLYDRSVRYRLHRHHNFQAHALLVERSGVRFPIRHWNFSSY